MRIYFERPRPVHFVDWSDQDAVALRPDLSADMNGDILVNCSDVEEVLAIMGETVNTTLCDVAACE